MEKKTDIKKLISNLKDIERGFMELAIDLRISAPGRSFTASSISLTAADAAELIKSMIPKEIELEGGGNSWWQVCPECHGYVDSADAFCRHCGQAIKDWK